MNLYEMSIEGIKIADLLMLNEGEITPDIETRLDAIMREGPDRIEAAAMVVQDLQASAIVCQQESLRLAARSKSFDQNAQRLKDLMAMALDSAFNGKVKTSRFTVWTQKSADTVAFDLQEEHALDEMRGTGYVREKLELNKVALREAYDRGEQLPASVFVEQVPGKRYTRIK